MNNTELVSLDNLPASDKIEKLELSSNELKGEELKKLEVY